MTLVQSCLCFTRGISIIGVSQFSFVGKIKAYFAENRWITTISSYMCLPEKCVNSKRSFEFVVSHLNEAAFHLNNKEFPHGMFGERNRPPNMV